MSDLPTNEFGQYQLLEKIAQGGMAEIFRGRALDSQGIEKPVVIKRILPQIAASPEFVEMLVDEAKIAVMLSHGNIAQVYDLGKVADDYFIVMEYVPGKTLSQIMKRLKTLNKKIPVSHAVWLCSEVANGLDYMHRKTDLEGNPLHIVHRDISPQNIILSTSGTVKIIDFGIAKAKTKVSTTDSGILKGKFAYMSPEHAEGERLDYRADIFSLGIILFELLTGERLFKGKNNKETIHNVKKGHVPLPSSRRKKISRSLDQIVLRALAKDRTKRFQTAEEFQRELTKYLVTQHPDFSPRELVSYLGELFPDVTPLIKEKLQQSTTETQKDLPSVEKSDTHEETAHASPDLIEQRLIDQEVYTESREEKTAISKVPKKPFQFPPIKKYFRQASWFTSIVVLFFLSIEFFPPAFHEIRSLMNQFLLSWDVSKRKTIAKTPPPPEQKPPPSPEITSGSLSISSEPLGAVIFLDDQKTESATPGILSLPAGKVYKIGLHADRYLFWEGTIQVDPGKTVSLSVPLKLNYGDLEVNTLPSGANLFLNGEFVGQTPFLRKQVAPETVYEIRLSMPGYEEWNRPIRIFGGKKEVVNVGLKKLPKSKALR
ncbi:MAG: serine/threonine protein kinase [Deltaproteobacteria bacterium]|nr:serine/threonine protein kinase [Deltaproteobacteria bacterium]